MPPFNAHSWKELVANSTRDAEFGPTADENQLAIAERDLGVPLPQSLREFLLEADGLMGRYSQVIWPAADVARRNREFRTEPGFRRLYMPFDHLLFFGQDGGGDQFAYAIHANGEIRKRDIYRWDHETDARLWFAAHLEQFLERVLNPTEE